MLAATTSCCTMLQKKKTKRRMTWPVYWLLTSPCCCCGPCPAELPAPQGLMHPPGTPRQHAGWPQHGTLTAAAVHGAPTGRSNRAVLANSVCPRCWWRMPAICTFVAYCQRQVCMHYARRLLRARRRHSTQYQADRHVMHELKLSVWPARVVHMLTGLPC